MLIDGETLVKRRKSPIGDGGMVVGVVSWIMAAAMVSMLLIRLAKKLAVANKGHRFGLDDGFIVLAALFSIGQTAAVSVEAKYALGQHVHQLSSEQLMIFEKAEYTANLLYFANMGCARISVCLLVKKILPGRRVQRTVFAFAIFSALWMVSGILVSAFPCDLPRPWEIMGERCINMIMFINYLCTSNIIFDMALSIVPLFIWNLKLSPLGSVSVSCVFLSRLSVVAFVSAQLVFFNRDVRAADITYTYWTAVLCMQIAQNLSIITACLPCLHPYIFNILRGHRNPETVRYKRQHTKKLKGYFNKTRDSKSDSMDSQSSGSLGEKRLEDHYCRPLATYGLDKSSAHLHSQHFNRFPIACNDTTPSANGPPSPPEHVFMRHVDISSSRLPSLFDPPAYNTTPKCLAQVGILPIADWETESSGSSHQSDDGNSERSGKSAGSKRDEEYVFDRGKVVSVPEAVCVGS